MQTGAWILEFMRSNPVFTLFTVLGCGYMVGRIRIGPISLGPVAGALIVSLVLGQYGFKINEGAQSVGFALFIFAVGYQAGPRFFEVLRDPGIAVPDAGSVRRCGRRRYRHCLRQADGTFPSAVRRACSPAQ